MGMSDCIKCWDTPCTCGYQYECWSIGGLQQQIEMLQRIITEKEEKHVNNQIDGESGTGS